MSTEQIYAFNTKQSPELAEVGGKAMSLIAMTRAAMPVPPGLVLTVAFFRPWLEAIQATTVWERVLNSSPENLKAETEALKTLCQELALDNGRRQVLADALQALPSHNGPQLYAVRSSSPEEDLEELSFAGGYETVLGVTQHTLEDAIRRCFASCLDERVFVYKREHGLPANQARIALIVQQQLAAETAGVAFSLNPVNNCYDEAVINANYGLGESVVSGLVSPDAFVVDKLNYTILARQIGQKQDAIWLAEDGGTYHQAARNRSQACLSDQQIIDLTKLLLEVENFYRKPMDIEWAFAGDELYLLQARPITAYFPVPEELRTTPGQPKQLYADLTLLKWGMPEPLSVLGTDYLEILNAETLKASVGAEMGSDFARFTRPTVAGRTYVNVSNSLKLQGKKRVEDFFRPMDSLGAEIIANLDDEEYLPDELPQELKGLMLKMIRQNLGMIPGLLQAIRKPLKYKETYLAAEKQMQVELAQQPEPDLSVREYTHRVFASMVSYALIFAPTMIATELARSRIKKLFKDEPSPVQDKIAYLERALPDNITIEMGLAMYHLAQFEQVSACTSPDEFAAKLQDGSFSPEFMHAYDAFMAKFGFRSPMEMDPAAPRFYEQPSRFFKQLKTMTSYTHDVQSPQAIHEKAEKDRKAAYQQLHQLALEKSKRKAKQLAKQYTVLVEFGGYRETPKYYVSLVTDLVRRHTLQVAQPLLAAGRLDSAEQVFDLTMDQLERGLTDPSLDLRALAEDNTRFLKKLRQVRELPRIVDSRGKILRAPRKEANEGEYAGEPISTGTAQGKIKVLHTPDEKPVLPGEILVTRATDPGWTPLFLNAAGIILEVGGMLQHGALVAREYGKPCVAGIQDATEQFHDGQLVEIDGSNGIVRPV